MSKIPNKLFNMSKIKIPKLKLSTGNEIPIIGLGTYKTENEPEKLTNAIKEAVKCGYKHFDCAFAYNNEDVIGKALNEAIKENNFKREEFFITTKLWNTFHSRKQALKVIDLQLKNLGLDYLDLYLIHWPMGYAEELDEKVFPTNEKGEVLVSDVHYTETYKAMEEIYKMGKVKSIGVSNFNLQQLQDVLNICEIKPAVQQIEIHPYNQNNEMIEFCKKHNIIVVAYTPLGAADRPWAKPNEPILLKDETINNLAKKYNKSPGQICLRWNIQKNIVVIPKSVTPSRIKENISIFDFELSNEDMELISKLDKKYRYYPCDEAKSHKYHPFK